MTLQEHPQFWRTVAAEERANGNDGLAEDYLRMADVAESLYRLLAASEDRAAAAEVGA
jgi:hypothetical protein